MLVRTVGAGVGGMLIPVVLYRGPSGLEGVTLPTVITTVQGQRCRKSFVQTNFYQQNNPGLEEMAVG